MGTDILGHTTGGGNSCVIHTDYPIVIMRFIALIFILFHHSTTIFTGWPPSELSSLGTPVGVSLLSGMAKLYGLGIFTFISGFLLANSQQQRLSWSYLGYKAKKVLLPCLIAAVIYYIFFLEFSNQQIDTINGTHLWYVPMIFLFYFLLPIVHCKSLKKIILFSLLFLAINILLFRLTKLRTFYECCHYFSYFMSGLMMNKLLKNTKINVRYVFTICFLMILFIRDAFWTAIYTTIIIACFYYILQYFLSSKFYLLFVERQARLHNRIKCFILTVSAQSFFIYILHQFVINILIKYMPRDIPSFQIVLFLSCFLASLFVPLCFLLLGQYANRVLSNKR